MYRFFLFRLIVRPQGGKSLYCDVNKGELLRKLIYKHPYGQVRKGMSWALAANVLPVCKGEGFHFEFGRIVEKEKSAFDDERNLFVHKDGEDVEYTDCFFFPAKQLLAVRSGHGITVAPNVIAKHLCTLLKDHVDDYVDLTPEEFYVWKQYRFLALPIKNPEPFLEMLISAFKVSKFTVEFGFPNPPDFKAKIQEPVQEFARSTSASHSTLEVRNIREGLDANELEEVARAASVLDNLISAKIHFNETDDRGTTINMQRDGEDAYVDVSDDGFMEHIEKTAAQLLERFLTIAPDKDKE